MFVKIGELLVIMFEGMVGIIVGIWIFYGEGKVLFFNFFIFEKVKKLNLVFFIYCDDVGEFIEVYFFNFNGLFEGIVVFCLFDG